jgi:hypothetical protein
MIFRSLWRCVARFAKSMPDMSGMRMSVMIIRRSGMPASKSNACKALLAWIT